MEKILQQFDTEIERYMYLAIGHLAGNSYLG